MAFRVVRCEKCDSLKVNDLKNQTTSSDRILIVKAKCDDCGHEFEYKTMNKLHPAHKHVRW